jgi:MoaD family protein
MPIHIKLYGRLGKALGSNEIEIREAVRTIGELLRELTRNLGPDIRRYIFVPDTEELSQNMIILVNGHSVKMRQGLNTPLLEGDEVSIDSIEIMEIVGGG